MFLKYQEPLNKPHSNFHLHHCETSNMHMAVADFYVGHFFITYLSTDVT
jgi:hypothetical protein